MVIATLRLLLLSRGDFLGHLLIILLHSFGRPHLLANGGIDAHKVGSLFQLDSISFLLLRLLLVHEGVVGIALEFVIPVELHLIERELAVHLEG